MILADSILQTASMARCISVAVMATHHTIFNSLVQARGTPPTVVRVISKRERSYALGA
jgi:hypothetical protein